MKDNDQNSKQTLTVLPRDCAKMDLKFLPIYQDLFSDTTCRCLFSTVDYIENKSIVKNPLTAFGRCRSLLIDRSGEPYQASPGDILHAQLISNEE